MFKCSTAMFQSSSKPRLPERKPIGNLLLEHVVVGTAAFRDQTTAKAGRKLCHPPWRHLVPTEDCRERWCRWKCPKKLGSGDIHLAFKWFQMVSNGFKCVALYFPRCKLVFFQERCIKTCHASHHMAPATAERTLPSSGELNHLRTSSSSGPNASTKWGAGKPQPDSKLYLASEHITAT